MFLVFLLLDVVSGLHSRGYIIVGCIDSYSSDTVGESKVNCWFCHASAKVASSSLNSWSCPSCEQYNGFSSDGSYNKVLPEHYDEVINGVSRCQKRAWSRTENGLCDDCNRNQALKIRQLALFEPSSDATFDVEVKQYKHHLERVYRLCDGCLAVVKKKLARQNQKFGLDKTFLDFVKRQKKNRLASNVRQNMMMRKVDKLLRCCKLAGFVTSLLVWMAVLHNLQQDSKTEMVSFENFLPLHMVHSFPSVFSWTWLFCVGMMLCEATCILRFRKRRYSILADLVSFFLILLSLPLFATKCSTIFAEKADLYVWQFASSTMMSILLSWTAIAPLSRSRRCKRTYRRGNSCNSTMCTSIDASLRSTPETVASGRLQTTPSSHSLPSVYDNSPTDTIRSASNQESDFELSARKRSSAADHFDRTRSAFTALRIGTPTVGHRKGENDLRESSALSQRPFSSTSSFQQGKHSVLDLQSKENCRPILSPARFNYNGLSRSRNEDFGNGDSFSMTSSQFSQNNSSHPLFGSPLRRSETLPANPYPRYASAFDRPGWQYLAARNSANASPFERSLVSSNQFYSSYNNINNNSNDDVRSVLSNFTSISRRPDFAEPQHNPTRSDSIKDWLWKSLLLIVLGSSLATNVAVLYYFVVRT